MTPASNRGIKPECDCDLWHCTMEDHDRAVEFNRLLWEVVNRAEACARYFHSPTHEEVIELRKAIGAVKSGI